MVWRLKRRNQRWREYPRSMIAENRWQAQRHGASGELIDFGIGEAVPFRDLVDEMIDLVSQDAAALDCSAEVGRARAIAGEGTSADRQIAVFEKALAGGGDEKAALAAVVDHLVAETLEGCAAI